MSFNSFFNFFPQETKRHMFGVVIALVKSTKDPEGLGRIQITFPWREHEDEFHWARIASLMAGNDRGVVFYPEEKDEVLVAFEHGDIDYPYIIGALWNGKDKPPEKNNDGKNNIKMIKTRSGHVIKIDDTKGKEKIEIIDMSVKNKISIDSSSKKIYIECEGDIELSAPKGKVSINAMEIEIKSSSSAKIEASSTLDLKGNMVNIN